MRRMNRAFTLVELLVVIGIIAVLISILLPVLGKVQARSQSTRCMAHLHDIGAGFQMYLNDSNGKLPFVNTMPSMQPPLNAYPSLPVVLEPYITNKQIYRCLADRILTADATVVGVPGGFDTYFDRETSSYQYDPLLALPPYAGDHINKLPRYMRGKQNLINLIADYGSFHAAPTTPGAMNHLFADMHVGDFQ